MKGNRYVNVVTVIFSRVYKKVYALEPALWATEGLLAKWKDITQTSIHICVGENTKKDPGPKYPGSPETKGVGIPSPTGRNF